MTLAIQRTSYYLQSLDKMGQIPALGTIIAVLLRIPTGIALLVCFAVRSFFLTNDFPSLSDRILECSIYQFIAFGFELFPVVGTLFHTHTSHNLNNLLSNQPGSIKVH